MKLLLIGQSVADIININGKETLQPGGIYYTITTLNALKESEDKISLITAVDQKYYYLFEDEYEKTNEKIFNKVENIPVVHLTIEKDMERKERYENINQSLNIDINNLNLFDGILINMITGFDITLEQLKNIRRNFKGLIYFDVHTLSRGLDHNMERYFRVIPEFKEWASRIDLIQVNENELFTLSDKKTEAEIADEILTTGAKYVIVTLEDKGAKVYYKKDNLLKIIYEPASEVTVRNKVGCGDVFGATFFYSYISMKEKNIEYVLKTANKAAGFAASCERISELRKMKKDVLLRFD